jgi:hypothetical protein
MSFTLTTSNTACRKRDPEGYRRRSKESNGKGFLRKNSIIVRAKHAIATATMLNA